VSTPNPPTARSNRKRLLLVVGLVAVVAAGVTAWLVFGEPTRTPPEVPLDGIDAEVAQAVRKAQAEVLKSPKNATAWGELGELLHAHIFHPEALTCYAEAERLAPDDPRWPYHQGMILYPDRPDDALVKLRRAAEVAPRQPEVVRLRYAELLLSSGKTADAREQYEAIRKGDLGHAAANLGLARVALADGDAAGCVRFAEEGRSSQHTRKAAHTVLAEAKLLRGDTAGAEKEQALAADLPPDQSWPDPLTQTVNRRKVGEKARLRYANDMLDKGQNRDAAEELKRLVKDYPASADGWVSLGYVLLLANADADATAALTRAVELAPANPRSHCYLGVLSHRKGDRKAAAKQFGDAIAAKPDYALAHFNLGVVLKEDGQKAEAEKALRESLRCQPNQSHAHAQLGELLAQDGKTDDARTHLEHAVRLNPKDAKSAELLAGLKK
jgi:tetratricopeptide (TPR) repeat protein